MLEIHRSFKAFKKIINAVVFLVSLTLSKQNLHSWTERMMSSPVWLNTANGLDNIIHNGKAPTRLCITEAKDETVLIFGLQCRPNHLPLLKGNWQYSTVTISYQLNLFHSGMFFIMFNSSFGQYRNKIQLDILLDKNCRHCLTINVLCPYVSSPIPQNVLDDSPTNSGSTAQPIKQEKQELAH